MPEQSDISSALGGGSDQTGERESIREQRLKTGQTEQEVFDQAQTEARLEELGFKLNQPVTVERSNPDANGNPVVESGWWVQDFRPQTPESSEAIIVTRWVLPTEPDYEPGKRREKPASPSNLTRWQSEHATPPSDPDNPVLKKLAGEELPPVA